VPTATNSLLILSEGKRILVDTGLGSKLSAKEQEIVNRPGDGELLAHLRDLGFQPEDIDIVVNTHLHADHCGGNTLIRDGASIPTFPRAEYWIQRLDWADALYPNERTRATYLPANLKPLEAAGQLRLLSGDTRVTREVKCVVTPGHTRAHQCVLIESGGQKALFLGDMAGRAIFMERIAWLPAYDIEPLVNLETRRTWRDWALEENALLIFEHDHVVTMGRLRQEGERVVVEPVKE
jgi:glyoxylase-like metal-dependent hydrolase (beta-lactamase superfamily II)